MINREIFKKNIEVMDNCVYLCGASRHENQQQTNDVFSEKWSKYEESEDKNRLYDMQKKWYLQLYGFESEEKFAEFLSTKKYIFDAGCGLGYKAKWFADLAPESIVIGMDFSDASIIAANNYKDTKNLYFIKGDIADTSFVDGIIDYVSCDQVIMHTENPDATFAELTRITRNGGYFSCYVYAKKALPRELLDEHFRLIVKDIDTEELWTMSRQLTELGKILSDLKIEIEVPDIPMLGIKGGKQNLQRFLYWNFIKCYWNQELGYDTSVITNFDWYSPSNAKRYGEDEYRKMIGDNNLEIEYFHSEEACYSGRFKK